MVASGGISSLADIRALAVAGSDAIEGAITGRAIYEGVFSVAEALAAAEDSGTAAKDTAAASGEEGVC